MRTVICPGSFDPVTLGHVDIIKRAANTFDKVIVAVFVNKAKTPCFSLEERMHLLNKALDGMSNVEVVACEGLLADYARERNATAVVKGLRAVSDFEYEFQMALTNKMLNPELETIFFTSRGENMYLSSSIVKSVASFGGDIRDFVPECIHDEIRDRLCGGEYNHES
ncbi:MAG: pantetheine-phosphate adenylyltransferase [Clostridia bacterium]|nr:pantetheine-phosphate adenylyltransferase [Clostridia bacterium]MBQ2349002.1 pantetheine-phosphate adenylyltransferase [Clostridia bacterium]MBQ5439510.1 pantetheine-phosphate adenylyltransferase [Clostridia bacterium]